MSGNGVVLTEQELGELRRYSVKGLKDAAQVSLNTVHRALAGQPVHRATVKALLAAVRDLDESTGYRATAGEKVAT